MNKRYGHSDWGASTPRRAIKSVWNDLAKYQKAAAATGEIHRVFVGSMMDIFETSKPLVEPLTLYNNVAVTLTGSLREYFFHHVVPNCPNLLFLLLTKRPGNILEMIPKEWELKPRANVMYGCSPVNQETFDRDVPKLLAVPGRRFLSCEPLLGPLEFSDVSHRSDAVRVLGQRALAGISWVIVGGESGPGARPMHPDWARSLRDQCVAVGVSFLFKQWGEYFPYEDIDRREMHGHYCDVTRNWRGPGEGVAFLKVGKKKARRLLDGREWNEMPKMTEVGR